MESNNNDKNSLYHGRNKNSQAMEMVLVTPDFFWKRVSTELFDNIKKYGYYIIMIIFNLGWENMNKGMQSHQHSISSMSLLYDYHWSMDLLGRVRDELLLAVYYLKEHLAHEKCACGDVEEDVAFYIGLTDEIENAIQSNDFSAIPWIQEQLHQYVLERYNEHPCIKWLLEYRHLWVWDARL